MSIQLKRFDRVVLTEDTFGYKKGTKAIFVNSDYKSGYPVYAIAIIDDSILEFFDKHNFKSFEDYILYQQKENIFGDQYWTNPFTVIYPDQNKVIGHKQLLENLERTRNELECLKKSISVMKENEKYFLQ